MKLGNYIIILILLPFLASSCVSYKKQRYIQDTKKMKAWNLKEFEIDRKVTEIIQPGDELFIEVTSSDDRPTNFDRNQTLMEVTLLSYTVGEDGNILFPYLGEIFVLNMTLVDLTVVIEEALKDYLFTPFVTVKFVNKKITVIGEVGNPGVYNFYDKNINLFQAIAHAGDITHFGKRKYVILIREENQKLTKYRLDLTDEAIFTSDLYIVKPNDIIYVEPLRSKQWGFETFPWGLILSIISMTLLIYTFTLTLY